MDKTNIEHFKDDLFMLDKLGNVRKYTIYINKKKLNGGAQIITYKGLIGGTIQSDTKDIDVGKNLGRANETTPLEQALSEANSTYNKLLDKGYKELPSTVSDDSRDILQFLQKSEGTDAAGRLRPMRAKEFELRLKGVFPCDVQPKYDGVRVFIHNNGGNIIFTSRNGKIFKNLDHLAEEAQEIIPVGKILDGELYCHGMTFQSIISAIKRGQSSTKRIRVRVYDWAVPKVPWEKRWRWLKVTAALKFKKYFKITPTVRVNSYEELMEQFDYWFGKGYEGVMIRILDACYEFGRRSWKLLKFKEPGMLDDEFKIIGVLEATGRDAGTAVFVVEVPAKKNKKSRMECNVRPMGTFEQRTEYWKNKDSYIDKPLTVKFQGYTDDGSLRFPRGIAVRDYE